MGWVRCAYQTRLARLLDCFFRHFRFFRTGRHRLQGEIRVVLPLTIYSGRGKWRAQASAVKILPNVICENEDIDIRK